MTDEQKAELRSLIEKEMEEVKKSIDQIKSGTKPVAPDNAIGRLTRMEAINSKSISEATLRSAQARLANLEKALREIDDEEFGICLRCEEPIPMERLMIVPESKVCVKCIDGR